MMTTTIKPKSSVVTFKHHAHGTGVAQAIQPIGSNHVINVDAAPVFGGHDAYPSPIAYSLAALTSCAQVTAQLVANDLGINLYKFDFDLTATFDTSILLKGAPEGNPNFESVEITASIETDATEEQFEQLRLETERRCPIYQLFHKSGVTITSHWTTRLPISLNQH